MKRPAFIRKDEGTALIETSVALTTLLLMMLGLMEFSRAIYADVFVAYAAHAATRYAMVRGSSWNGQACATVQSANCRAAASNIVAFVKSIAPAGIDITSNLTVSPLWPSSGVTGLACVTTNGPDSPGCAVQVQVAYNFYFALPVVSKNPIQLVSTSIVTIAQ